MGARPNIRSSQEHWISRKLAKGHGHVRHCDAISAVRRSHRSVGGAPVPIFSLTCSTYCTILITLAWLFGGHASTALDANGGGACFAYGWKIKTLKGRGGPVCAMGVVLLDFVLSFDSLSRWIGTLSLLTQGKKSLHGREGRKIPRERTISDPESEPVSKCDFATRRNTIRRDVHQIFPFANGLVSIPNFWGRSR